MSRIGKKAVSIPSGVTVTLDGQTVTVKFTGTEPDGNGGPTDSVIDDTALQTQ